VWQQTVTDDRGRRRFHGAFTGGFSAGYWNTVGSKEGWAPAQFVSSRGSRAKHEQTAQDFMDEEDLEAQRAAQTIKTNDQYDPLSGQGAVPSTSGPHESKLLNMIRPGALKIGEQLLTKMGWKPGQGVGPRLSMKARQRQARELGLVLDEDEDDAMEGEAAKHLYAPLDRPLAIYPVKENATGLGYSKQHASLQAAQAHASSSKSVREGATKMPMGGAFGISALEDADDDDLSVYDLGYRQRDTRLMELDDDDDADPYQVASRYSMKVKLPEAVTLAYRILAIKSPEARRQTSKRRGIAQRRHARHTWLQALFCQHNIRNLVLCPRSPSRLPTEPQAHL
jgi:G patch domain-containing protein 1